MGVVNVIGAGPVGLHCAAMLAEEGFDTSVFEEHPAIGRPAQCAGLVSKSGIEQLGVELGNSVVNEVRGARIFSPGGESITVERNKAVAYVIDRFLFDQMFYKKAKRLGCEIRTESKLIDIRSSGLLQSKSPGNIPGGNSLFLQSMGHGELLKSKITVGADGANSVVRHSVFPDLFEKDFVHAVQLKAEGKFDKNLVEMHFGGFAQGFFAWVVPLSSSIARIGLGVRPGRSAASSMRDFLQQKQLNIKTMSKSSALIPVAQPAKQLVAGSVLLVGDAAGQTKATTGGGLVFGLKAAEACAETIANHLKHRHSLENYSKKLQQLNKELAMHWKIYSYIQGLRPSQFDSLFRKARDAGIERFLQEYGDMDNPSTFMKKVLFKPKMWSLLPAVLKAI